LSRPLSVLDEAEQELDAAEARYEEQVAGLGTDFRLEVSRALDLISSLPRSGRPVSGMPPGVEVRQTFVRRFPFSITYMVEPATIWVIAFAHHRRRPGYWRRRLP